MTKEEKKQDFINSYYEGFNRLTSVSKEELEKYYDETKYGGYPEFAEGGAVWDSEARSIFCLIRILKPKKILEIGNYKGTSANEILQAVEENGFGDVTLVDIYDYLEYNKLHNKKFNRIIQDSLAHLNKPFDYDLIIQDGNHIENHVYRELELILNNNINSNYYIWSHDYWMRTHSDCGVNIAFDRMRNKNSFTDWQDFKDSISDCGFCISKIVK